MYCIGSVSVIVFTCKKMSKLQGTIVEGTSCISLYRHSCNRPAWQGLAHHQFNFPTVGRMHASSCMGGRVLCFSGVARQPGTYNVGVLMGLKTRPLVASALRLQLH